MPRYRYEYLEQELKQQIRSGYLKSGDRLPSIRTLCREYQLSKATVLHALHRMESEQLLQARPKSGYFVRMTDQERPVPMRVNTPHAPAPVSVPAIFRDIMARGAAFDILPAASHQDTSSQLIVLNRLIGRQMRLRPEQKA
ncbi:MAG: winged helix-turn-helix domain-containing protein, partial [Oceanospirillum sp.]|nr:winged helix-turn-helix domain-containing protein [Oceanospirillum sp.]